ncbi:MAG: hypothetical protein KQH63_13080 [Desulfobulbaceae bacterium]|nr:hypothetical protein [Desulfobulbaceae bacterium]
MNQKQPIVRKRDEQFATRTVTRIWDEEPSAENPYLARSCRCHGYDILELARKRSFVDVLFLIFQGELPSPNKAKLLETLMIITMNLGPRHPGTRAAMNAGVGKTNTAHILPISLSVISGSHLGGEEVVEAMHFLRKKRKFSPREIADDLQNSPRPLKGDWHIVPGFGSRFGDIDPMPQQTASLLLDLQGDWKTLQWGDDFSKAIKPHNLGWLSTGVTAAVLCDLGFHPRAGAGIFQILSAPGLFAHGLEMANKPLTAMPFLDEEHYIIEKKDP